MPIFDIVHPGDAINDPRYTAAIDLIRRTGARDIQIRYDDEQRPIVWVTTAGFTIHNGTHSTRGKINAYQAGCGLDPLSAIFGLCHACFDRKGQCTHCGRNTMFDETFEDQPLADFYCWYQWDPELKIFRRGCEGE
jgi:hypothetical protein